MNCDPEITCGKDMSLHSVQKLSAKKYYARDVKEQRALSLKNVIISCVDLTLSSPQNFSHYYLQYLVLGPSYVMTTFFLFLGSSYNHSFRSFMKKVCLLIILSLLCLMESAKCDPNIVQKYFSHQRMENLSDDLYNTSTTSNVKTKFVQISKTNSKSIRVLKE